MWKIFAFRMAYFFIIFVAEKKAFIIMTTKPELRKIVRQLKRQHTAEQLAEKSAVVCSQIMQMEAFRNSSTILLYHPLPDEVDTRILIDEAFRSGKTVILPVVVGDDLELRLYSPDKMVEGAFGIMEPSGELFTDFGAIDVAIIPGMGFDADCHRLGRGKGYYDRLLPRLVNAVKIGVCFDFQYLPQIPVEPHDVAMDMVVKG